MPTHPTLNPKKHWYKSKLTIFMACIITAALAYCGALAYEYWENYRDRPLGPNFTFVGRYYQSGCVGIVLCGGARNVPEFFYATDVDPIEIAKEFSGWSDKSQIYAADHYGYAFEKEMKNDALFETACKGIFKVRAQNDEVSAGVCYVKKPQVFYERYSLKPDKKRYLIYVDANDYNIIRSLSR